MNSNHVKMENFGGKIVYQMTEKTARELIEFFAGRDAKKRK